MSETVPTNARWRLISVQVDLAVGTSAIRPSLRITDGTNVLAEMSIPAAATASSTERLTWAGGMAPGQDGSGSMYSPLPADMPLLDEGYEIDTVNVTGDDNYAAPQLWVEEWILV